MKLRPLLLAGLALTWPGISLAAGQVAFPFSVVQAHKLSGPERVEVDGLLSEGNVFRLRLVIDESGAVTDVRLRDPAPAKGPDPALATATARTWRFRPFTWQGAPVSAVAEAIIFVRPKARWADPAAAFPPVDPANLRIELERQGCFGACPSYRVTLTGDGRVAFDGDGWVAAPGRHTGRVDPRSLDELVDQFRQARFFGLQPRYVSEQDDEATYVLRFSSGGRAMQVTDHMGAYVGAPEALGALEDAVDRTANSARWVEGDATTNPDLLRQGLDVHGAEARDIARHALEKGPRGEDVVLGLIDAGLPLGASYTPKQSRFGSAATAETSFGAYLLLRAVELGRGRLVLRLLDLGFNAEVSRADLTAAFVDSGGGCDPLAARALVAAGASATARESHGEPLLVKAATSEHCSEAGERRQLDMLKTLVALGAKVNAADRSGYTALFAAQEPEVVQALLAAGARIDQTALDGTTPLLATREDVTALTLLDAGADPHGHTVEGLTLRAHAQRYDMPGTLAWLDAHGVF